MEAVPRAARRGSRGCDRDITRGNLKYWIRANRAPVAVEDGVETGIPLILLSRYLMMWEAHRGRRFASAAAVRILTLILVMVWAAGPVFALDERAPRVDLQRKGQPAADELAVSCL